MNVLITLTTAGIDTGPFNLYSNTDSYVTAFETGVTKTALVAGYLSTLVPAGTTYVRVKSTGLCTNYIDIYVTGSGTTTTTTTAPVGPTTTTTTTPYVGPATTTTTTTSGGGTTTTTTTSGGPTTTTTTTPYVGPVTTTTTTTGIAYNYYALEPCAGGPSISVRTTSTIAVGKVVIVEGNCHTVTGSVGVNPNDLINTTEYIDCFDCGYVPGPTTTTTTTAPIPQEWYQLTNCDTLAVDYSWNYNVGSYSINERVTDISMNVYRITATYSSNPGGSNLFIATTGQTGCPSGTTTTTTTAAPVATNILVTAETVAGSDLDCLGTPYPRSITTVTATLYDQYGSPTNVIGSAITITVNTTYNPCYGGSVPSTYNIVIPGGNTASGASVAWDSSRTVDCGGAGCLLETDTYDCAASNTASLPFRAGTITC
jgi:hypothetical protein